LPEACSGLPDEACRAIKHSGKPVPAHLLGYGAQCNSACVYTLLGGLTRDVEPGAQLGVHAVKLTLIVKVRGNVKIPQSKLDAMGKTRLNNLNHGIRDYVEEMGIDPELFSIATKVPPSQVHFLTRDDIVRLRIDTRKNVETPWEVFEGKSNPPLLIKSVVGEAGGAFGQRVRAGMLAFTCDRGTGAVLIHSREPDGSNEITLVSVVAGKRSLAFPKYGSIRKTGELSFVVRGARVPRGFFTANDSDDHFSVLEVGQSAGAEQVLTFSMSETSAALDRFQQICTRAPTVQKQTQVRDTPSAKLSL
jgi:hypothetical protein